MGSVLGWPRNTIIALLLASSAADGQNDLHEQLWLDYNPSFSLSPRFTLFGDIGGRIGLESGSNSKLVVVRPNLGYRPAARVRLEAGVASFYTIASQVADVWEVRPWQGVGVMWPRSLKLDHYVRIEERVFLDPGTWESNWSLRSRYRIELPVELAAPQSDRHWRLYLSAEAFITLGPEPGERHRQMRGTLGLERAPARTWRLRLDTTLEMARRYRNDGTWTALCLRLRVYQRLN